MPSSVRTRSCLPPPSYPAPLCNSRLRHKTAEATPLRESSSHPACDWIQRSEAGRNNPRLPYPTKRGYHSWESLPRIGTSETRRTLPPQSFQTLVSPVTTTYCLPGAIHLPKPSGKTAYGASPPCTPSPGGGQRRGRGRSHSLVSTSGRINFANSSLQIEREQNISGFGRFHSQDNPLGTLQRFRLFGDFLRGVYWSLALAQYAAVPPWPW
mmetsp:Transcript_17510/g.49254  ORF Transcript_17510/g.49254 Transcript_17510/m.49254 type:complete len:211 (-) Transcript_17510:404-1036(-)